MSNTQSINWRDPRVIAWFSIGVFLLVNVGISLLNLLNKPLNPDEMQHLHISWLIAHGDIIYRDFWEHHGPAYAFLNAAIVYLTDTEPSLRSLFWSRFLSFSATGGAMIVTWLIARQLSLSKIGAFLAVAIYSSVIIVQTKGMEMRPDALQSLFWIGGLYLLIRNQSNGNLKQAILAGALFTLAILSNAKAGIGPFFVVVFYMAGKWLCALSWADIWRDMRGMVLGACLTITPFLIYFFINEAVIDFLYYSFWWNLEVVTQWNTGDSTESLPLIQHSIGKLNLDTFIEKQLPFLLLTITGSIIFLGSLGKQATEIKQQKNWLFFIATAGATAGWALDMYSQYFLMFLPLWAILASLTLLKIFDFFSTLNQRAGLAAGSIIAVAAASVMLMQSIKAGDLTESRQLRKQTEFTERFVSMTDRDEPVAIIWSLCGGYMFNQHVGYYWAAMTDLTEIITAMTGEHPHGQSFIDEMEERQVRYVVGLESWLTEGMSDEAMAYLRENFDYTDCLWVRKAQ